jgi:predicted DNA-binding protein
MTKLHQGTLVSVVFRLPREKSEAVNDLTKATRVPRSEYLREAIADVLKKHGVCLEPGQKVDGAS